MDQNIIMIILVVVGTVIGLSVYSLIAAYVPGSITS